MEETSTSKIDYSGILEKVEKFKNRKIYNNLDLETLNNLEDDALLQTIFDTLSNKVEANNYLNEIGIVKSYNIHKQMVYSIWVYSTELDNGGFFQFYENSK